MTIDNVDDRHSGRAPAQVIRNPFKSASTSKWIPAFAGMTINNVDDRHSGRAPAQVIRNPFKSADVKMDSGLRRNDDQLRLPSCPFVPLRGR
jgi:hypothetical protein